MCNRRNQEAVSVEKNRKIQGNKKEKWQRVKKEQQWKRLVRKKENKGLYVCGTRKFQQFAKQGRNKNGGMKNEQSGQLIYATSDEKGMNE